MKDLAQLARSRELLYMLTWRDIHIRYKQSIMGFLWAILMPALIVGAGAVVRLGMSHLTGKPLSTNDLASVMVRAVAWSFFIAGMRFGTMSLIGNMNLVSKIAFPKEVFPLAATFASFFDFVIASVAVLIALLLIGWVPSVHALWFFPLILSLIALTTGLSLLLSAANLFFRDVKYIVDVFLTYAIFFTPVLYEAKMLGKWESLIMWNPLAPILENLSATLVLHQPPDPAWFAYSTSISIFLLLVGYWVFKQLEGRFAENI